MYYLIRHGNPDYSYGDKHGFYGLGNDLAPLNRETEYEVYNTAKDERLKDAEIIISSPYTRALHTAAILSRKLDLEIIVDSDLREWTPDINFNYKGYKESSAAAKEYNENNGVWNKSCKYKWEEKKDLKARFKKALKRYNSYNKVIIVGHQMLFKTVVDNEKIHTTEIIEYTLN